MLIEPGLGRLSQKDCFAFEANLDYTVRTKPDRATLPQLSSFAKFLFKLLLRTSRFSFFLGGGEGQN